MTPDDYGAAWRQADEDFDAREKERIRARIDDVLHAHRWEGGYFCRCGIALNSPAGWGRHILADIFELGDD